MHSRYDKSAVLMVAAKSASDNAAYLVGFPTDVSAISQILESASRIVELALELGIPQLSELGRRLDQICRTDLSPVEVISSLNQITSQIQVFAQELHERSAKQTPPKQTPNTAPALDQMFTMANTRWVTL